MLFNTDLAQPVVRFEDTRSADQIVSETQVKELHAALERWAPARGLLQRSRLIAFILQR